MEPKEIGVCVALFLRLFRWVREKELKNEIMRILLRREAEKINNLCYFA